MSFDTLLRAALQVVASVAVISSTAAQQPARPLTVADMQRFQQVSDPRMSASGNWIVYTVSGTDTVHDRANGDIWVSRWDGTRTVRMTYGTEDEHSPQFAGSEHAISFLTSRGDPHNSDQLWLLPTDGRAAHKLTSVKAGVDDYAWAPA